MQLCQFDDLISYAKIFIIIVVATSLSSDINAHLTREDDATQLTRIYQCCLYESKFSAS